MAKYCPYCASPITIGNQCTLCNYASTYQAKPHHLRPGTLLNNRYLVGVVLGEGGFGITYQGRDLALDMKVAIKEYFPAKLTVRSSEVTNYLSMNSTTAGDDFRSGKERVLQEAQTMAKMDKEGPVVTVRDFFEENNSAYIVMEFVEGKDLRRIVRETGKPFAPDELLRLLQPVFGSLNRLHAQGLIHRDISPDNIMIENGAARLIDFGCSIPARSNDISGQKVLKHSFSPLEQYENRQMGARTDIYSMAATIYFCLTGQLPPNAMERARKDTLQPPSALGVKLKPRQEKALMRALSLKPEDRFATMEEFGKALFVFRNRYKRIAVAAGAVAVLAVIAAVVIRPAVKVEKLESAYQLTRKYTVNDDISSAQKEKIRAMEEVAGSDIIFTNEQDGTVYMEAVNTSEIDCTGVTFRVRFLDEDGVIVDTNSQSVDSWASGESYKARIQRGNIGFASVSVGVEFRSGDDTTLKTDYCSAELEGGASGVRFVVENRLPDTVTSEARTGTVTLSITSVEFTAGRTAKIGGKMTGGSIKGAEYIYLAYRLYSESGAIVKSDYIMLAPMHKGDEFRNATIYLLDLPAGKYRLELVDYTK